MPRPEAGEWYTWIWIGPARALLALLRAVLFALASALALALSFLLANLVAAPFLDGLSRRVEAIETGGVVEGTEGGLRGVWEEGRRALTAEIRRLAFFAALTAGITVAGIVVPGGQLVAPVLLVVVTMLFLPLQYSGYALDRRRVPFRERRRWVLSQWPFMLGFGAAAFLTFLVPGLNFLMIPALVVGGTLLAVRRYENKKDLTPRRHGATG
jgi:CysZ protein